MTRKKLKGFTDGSWTKVRVNEHMQDYVAARAVIPPTHTRTYAHTLPPIPTQM